MILIHINLWKRKSTVADHADDAVKITYTNPAV